MLHLLSLLGGDFYPEGHHFLNSIVNTTIGLEGALGASLDLFFNLPTGADPNHYINKYWPMCWCLNEFRTALMRIKQWMLKFNHL